MEGQDPEAVSRKRRLLMPALAQRVPIRRLSPDCKRTGSLIQPRHSYTATDVRTNADWLASYEKADVSRRVLAGVGASGTNLFRQEMARQGQAATISLSTTSLRSAHVVANGEIPFFFMAE
uniref:Uncharacterized protein n=1 Tax=Rousettus aegyptiacus TaxID=9407 RepID=A0A7J8DXP7_ROUAE|nr:hypothetical protein HJG63_008314 [Rousettus aegyptiacus]